MGSYNYGNGMNPAFMPNLSQDVLSDPNIATFDKAAHVASPNPTSPQSNDPNWAGMAGQVLQPGGVKSLVNTEIGKGISAGGSAAASGIQSGVSSLIGLL